MSTPNLIDAARVVDKLFANRPVYNATWCDARKALSDAVDNLPPDPVIVPRALLLEVAAFINRWSYARPEDDYVTNKLREAAVAPLEREVKS